MYMYMYVSHVAYNNYSDGDTYNTAATNIHVAMMAEGSFLYMFTGTGLHLWSLAVMYMCTCVHVYK